MCKYSFAGIWRVIVSTSKLQKMVSRIKKIIDVEFGVTDKSGTVIACSTDDMEGQMFTPCVELLQSNKRVIVEEEYTCKRVEVQNKTEYVMFVKMEDKLALKYLDLISINIENIRLLYDERYDKTNFMKSIMIGNVMSGDIHIRSKDLGIKYEAKRVVYLIKTNVSNDIYTYNIVKSLFPQAGKDFVILLDDERTVLIKEFKKTDDKEEVYKKARIIIDTINSELMIAASVSVGTIAETLGDVAKSYKESQIAMEVGEIFETDKVIIDYNNLGIGRLIYQLPATLCRLFLNEVFKEGTYEAIDSEAMMTIQKFFENNLNVSETSRQLFIHRNTLVYRLDKIQKMTGMDLRVFDDAIYFKVAMMVKKYLEKSMARNDF